MQSSTVFPQKWLFFPLFALLFLSGCQATLRLKADQVARPAESDLTILRDKWGTPHIYGKTDPDVAFGMGYAQSEDHFGTLQDILLAARTRVAAHQGREGAAFDFFIKLFDFPGLAREGFSQLSPDTQGLYRGFVNGVNYYAALHPGEVKYPEIFPVTDIDLLTGVMFSTASFLGVPDRLAELFRDSPRHPVSSFEPSGAQGSNAFAISPNRMADGSTVLVANTHQPWEGPFSWYEAHVHSETGWNLAGGLFPGAPMPLIGFNEHLGWTHTVNRPDFIDTYKLVIHPDNPLLYRFDGEWLPLEERTIKLKVRVFAGLKISVKRNVYQSKHGPAIETPHGVYAIRYASYGDVGTVEQWYRMGRATNFQEWEAAMKPQKLPMFNTVYADETGHIAYVYNAKMPIRTEGYDYSIYLPGDTSATLWDSYLPYEQMPRVINPPSGFVQNCNGTPFKTTTGSGNPSSLDYSYTFGIEQFMNNRELRAIELFGGDESLTYEEVMAYKYDMGHSPNSLIAQSLNSLRQAGPPSDPVLRDAYDWLLKWDLQTNPENRHAALAMLTYHGRLTGRRLIHNTASLPPNEEVLEALGIAVRHFNTSFGTYDIPWSDVNRLQKGSADFGMGGGPDILHAVYGEPMEDGRFRGIAGDSHIIFVQWKDGEGPKAESIQIYGNSREHPESPHYTDQSELFSSRQMKPFWFEEADIRANLEREYYPGQE